MQAYLDHAATTPIRPEARRAMDELLDAGFGNPSGSHRIARRARQRLEDAREQVAAALGARPAEVVFTSGGTESDNLAVLGAAALRPGARVLCSAVEHDAVLESVRAVGGETVAVDEGGVVDLDALRAALDPSVGLVSVMLANNEVGVVQPLAHVAGLVRKKAPGALVHSDAVHAAGWLDVGELTAAVDLVTVSAHKFGGPAGIGALVLRGVSLPPVVHGGGQEAGRRSGTQNLLGAVGMAAAITAAVADRPRLLAEVAPLRNRLADGLLAAVPGAVETGRREAKVGGSCHLCIPGLESESLLFLLDEAGVCASAGSACASGAARSSHVLAAMGVAPELAAGALRLSLGWTTTAADVDVALAAVPEAARRLARRVPALRR